MLTLRRRSWSSSPQAETDLLVLPDTNERFPVEIRLEAERVASGGASSFALGNEQHVVARASALRGAYCPVPRPEAAALLTRETPLGRIAS